MKGSGSVGQPELNPKSNYYIKKNIVITKGMRAVIECMIPSNDYERSLCRVSEAHTGMDSFPIDIYNDLIEYYLLEGNLRNVLYLICHANWGMRAGDVTKVRFCDIFSTRGTIRDDFTLGDGEQKTGKKNIYYNNDAVKTALTAYLKQHPERKIYEYIFISNKRNGRKIKLTDIDKNAPEGVEICQPISVSAIETIIKDGLTAIGIFTNNGKFRDEYVNCELSLNTHSLRKTFANLFYDTGCRLSDRGELDINPTMLKVLQDKFMHSSSQTTGHYNRTMERIFRKISMEMNTGLDILERYYVY